MKPLTVILSVVVAGIALMSDFTAASADRINGRCCLRCCMSSDGGRSHRYIRETKLAATSDMQRACSLVCSRFHGAAGQLADVP
jgi:hypothetical protein